MNGPLRANRNANAEYGRRSWTLRDNKSAYVGMCCMYVVCAKWMIVHQAGWHRRLNLIPVPALQKIVVLGFFLIIRFSILYRVLLYEFEVA